MAERWLPVVGYNGLYEVSDLGRVRSYVRSRVPRLLRPGAQQPSGHLSVVLGRGNTRQVHRLVTEAFLGPRPPGLEVRHLDGDAKNNTLTNLEYATRSRNSQDKKWHRGARNYRLKPDEVRAIKARLGPLGAGRELAREFGVSESTISSIKHAYFHRDIAA